MWRAVLFLWSAALLLIGGAGGQTADPVTLTGELTARLGAIPVAVGSFEAVVADGLYRISGHGRTAGVGRLFSDGEARVESTGPLSQSTILPSDYRHELKERRDRDRVEIAFDGQQVASISIVPPQKPRRDRVPLGAEHVRGVLDPLSAVMQLSAGPPGPQLCDRTLPIFDGEQRYDIELSFKREERVGGLSGIDSGTAYVCGIRYRPVAGHRPAKSAVKHLQKVDGIEVWLANVGAGVVAPIQARVPTPLGQLIVSATRLSLQ
ncbi:MAG TPA: DUF3108 domain-containing protein [Woeseiaceae bacterium]|nr:DUF3108 domain-containing protein [Woeseiaceae bacterium]